MSTSTNVTNLISSSILKTEMSDLTLSQKLHCGHGSLMTPLGLFIQGLLAFVAFCSLIVKRFCEPRPERRPWRIWFYDTSKQAFGAAVIHFANVFLADIFQGDPCTWYIVSFLLDSTVGLIVIWLGLKVTQWVVHKKDWETLRFGEYGNPPQCNAWMGQCGLYILVMIVEKILMTLLVQFHFWRDVRKFIMSPIKSPDLELILVMFVIPVIVNAIMFWVVDNFLKRKIKKSLGSSNGADSSSGSSVKYVKATNKVKYYSRTENVDGSESDVLLSLDEDMETRFRIMDRQDSNSDQYRLLASGSS